MKTLVLLAIVLGLSICTTTFAAPPPRKKMKAFKSERELKRYFEGIAEKQKRAALARRQFAVETVTVSAGAAHQESITNTQQAGVDEGGIVKLHGDHLVILRRGRIFTVAIGDGALKPVSAIDAFGPDINPARSWYDEMLISGDTIVVIGYSYAREGTEVGLFNIDARGQLSYRSTYHLRSNDYYSARNYASRLIGSKLIFYTPLLFDAGDDEDPFRSFPAVRKWRKGTTGDDFRRIVRARDIFRPEVEFNVDDGITLHTVTTCDLANGGFACHARSVIGPSGNVFYVSSDSVYVWAHEWSNNGEHGQSILFRLPLDGSGPGALRVSGEPVDQFSFLQSDDGHLNVLVLVEPNGEATWNESVDRRDVSLVRVPLWSFSDGSATVPSTNYRQLPKVEGDYVQNRFVGDYLLYGTAGGWGHSEVSLKQNSLVLAGWRYGGSHQLPLSHGVERIEQIGEDAVVIGADEKDLHFTSIRLGPRPEIASRYKRENAAQEESRSHAFFYKPDSPVSGTLGLPITVPDRPGYTHVSERNAGILFLRNDALQFQVLGQLDGAAEVLEDACRASCLDWYGNARPLFLGRRIIALIGYELVEGKLENGRIVETRRVSYAPVKTTPQK